MNPLTNVKNIIKLNETELATGSIHKKSWHDMYKDSAWIFIGGLGYGLTEGDILAVFSQYGEIVNINLVRDKKTGKTKGFCFLCYANQKSTVLAVDNLNGIKLCSRTIRVDHVSNYKPPKEDERDDEITKRLKAAGCAPKPFQTDEVEDTGAELQPKKKKSKKEKKEKKKKKKKSSNRSDSENEASATKEVEVKKEKHDPGYDKYDTALSRRQEKSKYSERGKDESEKHYSRPLATIKRRYSDNSSDDESHTKHDNIRKNNKQERVSSHFKESYRKYNKSTSYNDGRHVSSSKSYKRQRSSSSDDDSRNRNISDRSEKLLSKHGHSESRKRRSSNSSSSDDESSSESSSDSEKDKTSKWKKSRKEQYEKEIMRETEYKREIIRETAYERKVSKEKVLERDKSHSDKSKYQQRKDSDYSPKRKEQYARSEKYFEHRSKHRSDDKYSNSHKSKYDKR